MPGSILHGATSVPWPSTPRVRVHSLGDVTLSSPGLIIDGVSLSAGDLFLADNQSTPSETGVYVYTGSATAATRSDLLPVGAKAGGTMVVVKQGTDADKLLICINDDTQDTVGTHALTYATCAISGEIETGTALTTDDTVTTVWSRGLENNTAYFADIVLMGRRSDSAGRALYHRTALVYVESGTLTIATPDAIGTDVESTAGYDITIDNSSTTLRVRATGASGHTIRWVARVNLVVVGS